MRELNMYYDYLESPIGRIALVGDGDALAQIGLPDSRKPLAIAADWRRDGAPFAEARRQFEAYFNGDLTEFELALAPRGSDFQCRVWSALCDIPYGITISYGELAQRIGNPNASRAVGLANGANPLAIVVPCHRVIGANGSLTGYGGGLPTKKFLLDLERRHVAAVPFALSGERLDRSRAS
jgi:methylated-DNA-[protein]-cysteine S-methyltransferase